MTYDKTFKSLDEQIEILKAKGLIINDVDKTKSTLFRENYFFISGYRHVFMDGDKGSHFITGTTFEELYAFFVFDRKIRNIFFSYILIIENNIKSIMSYQLSKKYGYREKNYLNPRNFNQDAMKSRQVKDILNKMRRQIRVNGEEHSATSHYIDNYGYIPLWILVKVLSFGIMSELYNILKMDDRIAIANVYNLDAETLEIYLSTVASYRNICAHEEVLFDHHTQRSIPNCRYHEMLNIEVDDFDEYKYGKNDLFAVLIIMRQLLLDNEFNNLINAISNEVAILDAKVSVIPLNRILNTCSFPNNWKDIANMR